MQQPGDCGNPGVLQSADHVRKDEHGKILNEVLMPALEPIEGVRVLVISWSRVKIRVADLVPFSTLHDAVAHEARCDQVAEHRRQDHVTVVVGKVNRNRHLEDQWSNELVAFSSAQLDWHQHKRASWSFLFATSCSRSIKRSCKSSTESTLQQFGS
jgi:hypothetical protein